MAESQAVGIKGEARSRSGGAGRHASYLSATFRRLSHPHCRPTQCTPGRPASANERGARREISCGPGRAALSAPRPSWGALPCSPALARLSTRHSVAHGPSPLSPKPRIASWDPAAAFESSQEGAAQSRVNQADPLVMAMPMPPGGVPGSVPASSCTEKGNQHPGFGIRSPSLCLEPLYSQARDHFSAITHRTGGPLRTFLSTGRARVSKRPV